MSIIKNGLILMVYSLVAGALLAFVYLKTAPIIEAQKAAQSGDAVMAQVLPGVTEGFEKQGEEGSFVYWIGGKGRGEPAGYVFIARGKGYSSTIESMVGVDTDGRITGIKILFQQETPGLGDKVQQIKPGEDDPWFPRQFLGKSSSDDLRVKKDGGIVDAISGATISSRAVTESIRNNLQALEAALSGQEYVPPPEPEIDESAEPEEKPITMPSDDQLAEALSGMAGGYEIHDGETEFPYWTVYSDADKSTVGGHLFIAREEGFASMIETLVGVDTDGTIKSIKILAHEETPEYGGRMEEVKEGETGPWFLGQFIGKTSSDAISLKDDGGVIDAVTDATISSKAFTKSIGNGLKRLEAVLSGETFIPEEEPEDEEEEEAEALVAIDPEEAFEDVLPAVFGGYVPADEDGDFPYWIGYRDPDKTEVGGYLFVAEGEGFASTIRTLVGVDSDLEIVGIKVLSHEETDGWGAKIMDVNEGEDEPWFLKQFIGKSISDTIALTANEGDIDAISEATITSQAVTESIDTGLKQLQAVLTGETFVPEESSDEEADDEEEAAAAVPPEKALEALFPNMPGGFELFDEDDDFPYWKVYSDLAKIEISGYAFVAVGEGFASTIETMVAVDPEGKIIGVQILFHEETEGWGSKISEIREGESDPWFPQQFIGKSISDTIALSADEGDIDAISEATITSGAVTESIGAGMKKLAEVMK